MAYSEAQKKYANEWYHKNKERLNSLPHRKEAKKISDRKYYEKNKDKLRQKAKDWRLKNADKYQKRKKKYYADNRDRLLEVRRQKRQTEAYKIYMKEYRRKNKGKIRQQEKKKGKEWAQKQINAVSDNYIITLLCNSKVGIFKTHEEAKKHPELIELKRTQILLSRMKRKINQHDKVSSTRANKRYKNIR